MTEKVTVDFQASRCVGHSHAGETVNKRAGSSRGAQDDIQTDRELGARHTLDA